MLEAVPRAAAHEPHIFHFADDGRSKNRRSTYFRTGTRASRPPVHSALPENGSPHISAPLPPPQPSANAIACPDRRALRDDRVRSLARGPRCLAFRNIHLPETATWAKPAARIVRLPAARQKRRLPAGLGKFSVQESRETLCRATTRKQKQIAPPKSFRRCYMSRCSNARCRFGVSINVIRNSTPSLTASSTTAATARRAISTPLFGSKNPRVTRSNET